MSDRREPTAAEVRAWESATGRGHAAAAEHFRAQGYDVTPERVKELYRQGGSTAAGKGPSRAREETAPPPEPAAPPPPPQLPAIVTHPAGSLEWYEAELVEVQSRRRSLTVRDGQAYAQLSRQAERLGEKIAELRAAAEAKSAQHLSALERLARLRDHVGAWPEMALEIPTEEYVRRKGYRLFDPKTGQWLTPDPTAPAAPENAGNTPDEDDDA